MNIKKHLGSSVFNVYILNTNIVGEKAKRTVKFNWLSIVVTLLMFVCYRFSTNLCWQNLPGQWMWILTSDSEIIHKMDGGTRIWCYGGENISLLISFS